VSDFVFVGRYTVWPLDFVVYDEDNAIVDADAPPTASFCNYSTGVEVFSRALSATAETGVYRLTLSSAETATHGLYYVVFTYDLGAIAQECRIDIEVSAARESAYMALPDTARLLVERVWNRFEDLFDSAIGGPHLREYAQSSFGRDRVSELLVTALGRLNIVAQPHQTYSLDSFPYPGFGGLLELATYVEVIKHLIRSYVEQPTPQGVQTVRLDRTGYSRAWSDILASEQKDLKAAMDVFKISSLGLGRAAVLVAGGVYGEWSRPTPPTRPRIRQPTGWMR
jgi:hypothetical protein